MTAVAAVAAAAAVSSVASVARRRRRRGLHGRQGTRVRAGRTCGATRRAVGKAVVTAVGDGQNDLATRPELGHCPLSLYGVIGGSSPICRCTGSREHGVRSTVSHHGTERRSRLQRAHRTAVGRLMHEWFPSTQTVGTASTRCSTMGRGTPFCADAVPPSAEASMSAAAASSRDVRSSSSMVTSRMPAKRPLWDDSSPHLPGDGTSCVPA